MWLGIPIALWILIAIMLHILLTFAARCLFEYILTKRDIIYFQKGTIKDDYSSYFTFIFFWMYAPGLNILFIIVGLVALEIDNLKLMKFKQ